MINIGEAGGVGSRKVKMHRFEIDNYGKVEGVVIRPTPANPKERYFDTKQNYVNFQVLVKFKDQQTALQSIYMIDEFLDGKEDLENLSYVETYVEPKFVERTETGHYIYTALYKAIERI